MPELDQGREDLTNLSSPITYTCPSPKKVNCNLTGGKFTVTWTFSDGTTKTETYSLEPNQLRGSACTEVTQLDITPEQVSNGTLDRSD
jgi:hypothetical protein